MIVSLSLDKRSIVLASGVFDLIHPGHVRFLEKAKEAGGPDAKLIVIVATDATVKKMKGVYPVLPESERKILVEALKPVDEVYLGSENLDISGAIRRYKPKIVAVGYDQNNVEQMVRGFLKTQGLPIQVIKIGRFGLEEFASSSKIKHKIVHSC